MDAQSTAMLVIREPDASKSKADDAGKPVVDTSVDAKKTTKHNSGRPGTSTKEKSVTKQKKAKQKKSKKTLANTSMASSSDSDTSDESIDGTSSNSDSSCPEDDARKRHRSKKHREAAKEKRRMRMKRTKKPTKSHGNACADESEYESDASLSSSVFSDSSCSSSDSDEESSSNIESNSDSDSDSRSGSDSGSGYRNGNRRHRSTRGKKQPKLLQQQQKKQQQDFSRLLLLQQQQQQQQQQPPPPSTQPPLFNTIPSFGQLYGQPYGQPYVYSFTPLPSIPAGMNPLGYGSGGGLPTLLPPAHHASGGRNLPPPGIPGTRHTNAGRLGVPRDILGYGLNSTRSSNGLRHGHRADQKRHKAGTTHKKRDRTKPKYMDFKRVDQVWDNTLHNYKLQDTAERSTDTTYDGYLFHVRRTFDWEGKYKQTIVDIKSKVLREVLQTVMGDIKGVSLVEETPKLDPNLLFLYLDDMRAHVRTLKTATPTAGDKKHRRREARRNARKRQQLKVLIKYLDKDYEDVKNSLKPLLDNGLITFDLLWALWKPNTLTFTTTYGSPDQPRVFKAEVADRHFAMMKGEYYFIEGKYFEYDGKRFGFGSFADEIEDFKGTRKITSLPMYPLKYHKNEEQIRRELIERGKKFVSLSGVQYRNYDGMAYYKKKRMPIKVNISGRIMVDASIHRRINPNYPISVIRPKEHDVMSDTDDNDSCGGCRSGADDGNDGACDEQEVSLLLAIAAATAVANASAAHARKVPRIGTRGARGARQGWSRAMAAADKAQREITTLEVVPDKDGESTANPTEPSVDDDVDDVSKKTPIFTDEEYLLASPIVLGFAFGEKLWLEFSVSATNEIQWNENAYESLVLEPKTKDIVKALVESHKYHATESIDDVIQGKGKGLVAVLHGPPGTGKTLTAEGISELLKCPLYMVSAGELGTDSRFLESELQRILDICHAWGAILLLDEADVFLEKRNMHDVHRNALVSIFLRQLEYFQGILFLTTNRVETFDDAFQSRIHIALRYDNLDARAKKTIFKLFIERVRVLEKIDLMPFSEEDYSALARHELNGRQIKNTVRTAQALAVNKGEPLSMAHIRQVLDVQMSFDRDLKGGPGFQDAMRSYF